MLWLISIILIAILLVLLRHSLHLRRLLHEMDVAARSKRRLLPKDSAGTLRRIGALECVDSLNGLIDSHNEATAQKKGYSSQVEAMLGAVQEAVIVFSTNRVIEYANRSADLLFRDGQSIQGLRLEGMLRSPTMLELLDDAAKAERTEPRQIRLDREGETLWFEASSARVIGTEPKGRSSTLLVLHDISQLKAMEVMRREFVANVSHELRTPLTIIKGFAETLIDDESTINAKARRRFTEKILNNADRLHVLVEDLLTLTRLESRPDQIEPIRQPLTPLLEEVADNYRSRLNAGTQRLELAVDAKIGTIAFDRYRILQVLDNFIENAFRYAPDFTVLRLEAKLEPKEGMVQCVVDDDGPGIPEKDLPHLFERFYRVDKGRSRDTGGTGLGLSIVKHIVQLHGGTVRAESQIGEGTRMIFTLPTGGNPDSPSAYAEEA